MAPSEGDEAAALISKEQNKRYKTRISQFCEFKSYIIITKTHRAMSEQHQDEKRTTNDNKENIPKKDEKSKSESVTVIEENNVDLSGFQPVVSHTKRDKKNKKFERQKEDEVKMNPQRSKRNKSKDKSDKPRKKNVDEKPAKNVNDSGNTDSSQSNSSTRDDEKKVKFVEAPLPKENPWVKPASSTAVDEEKPKNLNLKVESRKMTEKVAPKTTQTLTVDQTDQY